LAIGESWPVCRSQTPTWICGMSALCSSRPARDARSGHHENVAPMNLNGRKVVS
jgi:hypothetical protein